MKKLVAILLTFLLVLTGCTSGVKVTKVKDDTKTDAIKFHTEYPAVKKDNVYKYVSLEKVMDIIKSGSGVIYLGFPACPWCKELTPVLNDMAKTKDVKEVYYYNFRDVRENNTKEYQDLLTLLKDYIEPEEDGSKRISAPTTVFIQNGVIKGVHVGTVDTHNAHERKMTEEEKTELNTILSDLFDKVYNDDCDC